MVGDDLREARRLAIDTRSRYANLQTGGKDWNRIVGDFDAMRPALERSLVRMIADDIAERNDRMLAKLQELAQKVYLIEIEIFNGASQDVVWKNSHPEYEKYVDDVNRERKAAERAKVWDWGQVPLFARGSTEVWSDELGTMRALVFDNCQNKDRYIEVMLNKDWKQSAP